MDVLNLHAKQDYLEKIATTRDPIKALAEFVWNALDADSERVEVLFSKNALGGLESISIADNGSGIAIAQAKSDFANLGDSWKRKAVRTKSKQRALHGKEGRGRFRFFSLADSAEWVSTYRHNEKIWELKIRIDSSSLDKSTISDPVELSEGSSGTTVLLKQLKNTFDWLTSEEALREFSAVFAPYILQYPDTKIIYNGRIIDPATTIARSFDFPVVSIICPNRTVSDLTLKVIEWNSTVESRKIHFGADQGIILGSQAAGVVAPGFEFSAYAYSSFFKELAEKNLLELDDLTDLDFSKVLEHVREELNNYFRKRQSERSTGLIDELKSAGAYPYEGDPLDEIERRERQVFDIATYAVSSYSKDFKRADNSLKKMTLTLMKEALRHNPESLANILRAVVNLPKNRQDEFAGLLGKTELGNIISASSLIASRVTALEVLKGMVFDPKHSKHVRERGELDALVRDNTWMFGENFHISLPEVGLSKIMDRVSLELATKPTGRKLKKANGKTGRADAFLGRSIPQADGLRREFILVELKRPSLVIGRKELDQVEDYVNAIMSQPDFSHTQTCWHFFVVTSKYDDAIANRIKQKGRPAGLFIENDNSKVWVKTWAEIIRECESRLQFVQDKLKLEISTDDIESRINQLKSSILREQHTKPNSNQKHSTQMAPSGMSLEAPLS